MIGAKSAGRAGAGGAILLGGNHMPATSPEADRSFREERVTSALSLMGEALAILDELDDAPDLAARSLRRSMISSRRAGLPAGTSGSDDAPA